MQKCSFVQLHIIHFQTKKLISRSFVLYKETGILEVQDQLVTLRPEGRAIVWSLT